MKFSGLLLAVSLQSYLYAAEEAYKVDSTVDRWALDFQRLDRAEIEDDTLKIEGSIFTNGSAGRRLEAAPDDLTLAVYPRVIPSRPAFNPEVELDLSLNFPEQPKKTPNNFGKFVLTSGYIFGFKAQLKLPSLKKNQTWKFFYKSGGSQTDFIELDWDADKKKWSLAFGPLKARQNKDIKVYNVTKFAVPHWDLTAEKIEQISKDKGKVALEINGQLSPFVCKDAKKTKELAWDVDSTSRTTSSPTIRYVSLFSTEKTLDPLGTTCESDGPEKPFISSLELASNETSFGEPVRTIHTHSLMLPLKGKKEREILRRQLLFTFKDEAWEFRTHDAFPMTHPLDN